ncbi:hypothetical protein D9757_011018 [Collybiopsis confluens]|uniref:Uncharacterized protein n=1 Tax=Collybiopsis confluens TaxID=2823264 RepID=A0A8H5GD59_9AGAR|nr:hypothetical protein D9757_011018 [Collybiopsis confluens]
MPYFPTHFWQSRDSDSRHPSINSRASLRNTQPSLHTMGMSFIGNGVVVESCNNESGMSVEPTMRTLAGGGLNVTITTELETFGASQTKSQQWIKPIEPNRYADEIV